MLCKNIIIYSAVVIRKISVKYFFNLDLGEKLD